MTLNFSRIIAGLALSLVAGCGAPGAYDTCVARCEALLRCFYQNEAMTENCKTSCNNNKGGYGDDDTQLAKQCKNSGDIRKAQHDCYTNGSCQSGQAAFELATGDCSVSAQTKMCIVP